MLVLSCDDEDWLIGRWTENGEKNGTVHELNFGNTKITKRGTSELILGIPIPPLWFGLGELARNALLTG